jgi:hypothetical protein
MDAIWYEVKEESKILVGIKSTDGKVLLQPTDNFILLGSFVAKYNVQFVDFSSVPIKMEELILS